MSAHISRPTNAISCSSCSGRGEVGTVDHDTRPCSRCGGKGWTVHPPPGAVIVPKPAHCTHGINPVSHCPECDPQRVADPILPADLDIPLDRMAREFRKRAGRAFGLGKDDEATEARKLCAAIEAFDSKWGRS